MQDTSDVLVVGRIVLYIGSIPIPLIFIIIDICNTGLFEQSTLLLMYPVDVVD